MSIDVSVYRASLMVVRQLRFLFSLGSARVLALLLSAATFPFLVRVIGVEKFGRWSYVLAVVGLFELMVNPGVISYATREVAAKRTDAISLVAEVFSLRLLLGILGVLLLVVYSFVAESDRELRGLLVLYGVPVLLLGAVQSGYLLSANEFFHWASIQQVATQGAYAIGVFIFVRAPDDIYRLALISLLSVSVSAAIGWKKLGRAEYRLAFVWAPGRFLELLRQSLALGAASISSYLYTRSGHIIVRWILGEGALGLYAAAIRLVEVIHGFVGMIFSVTMPRLALYSSDEIKRAHLSWTTFLAAWVISLPLAVGGSALAPDIIKVVLGNQYIEASSAFRILSFYLLTNSMAMFFCGTVLFAMGRRTEYLISTASGAVFGILINIAFVSQFGIEAACLSYAVSQLVVAAVAFIMAPRNISFVFARSLIAAPLIGCAFMAAILYMVRTFDWPVAVVVFVGAMMYALTTFVVARRDWLMLFRRGASQP